ncbi:MAG: GNAT family N-acetyltransferase [Aurantibacter sp.]
MRLKIRQCSLGDLDLLIEISKRTFSEAFEKINNPGDFEDYIKTAFSETRLKKELQNPNSDFYFVYADTDLAGYFKVNLKTAQTEFKNRNSLELERIYVLHAHQGKKIGSWILQEVLKMSASAQKSFVWLGVWQKNARAIEFYERHGFEKIGTHPYFIGRDQQTDWLMRYSLQD